jgi:hypothetical protein
MHVPYKWTTFHDFVGAVVFQCILHSHRKLKSEAATNFAGMKQDLP